MYRTKMELKFHVPFCMYITIMVYALLATFSPLFEREREDYVAAVEWQIKALASKTFRMA